MCAAAGAHRALTKDEATTTQDLLQAVLSRDNLARAWQRVQSNKGAPGIDGVTVQDWPARAREHWSALRAQIEGGRYRPQAVRRVEIPKPDGGLRRLGIPTVTDRVVQQAIAQVLTPIFEQSLTPGPELDRVLGLAAQASFRVVALFPAFLLLVFAGIWLYDRSKGRYRPQTIKRDVPEFSL